MFTKEDREALDSFLRTPGGKGVFRAWSQLSGMYHVSDHNDPHRALVEKGKKDFFIVGICDNIEPATLRNLEA